MNFGAHKNLARAKYKEAQESDVTDDTLLTIFKNGAIDIAFHAKLFPTNKYFAAVADQKEYLISDVADDYLCMHESGLWFNYGTVASPDYDELDVSTIESLDNERSDWRNEDSGAPEYYVVEQNNIIIHPTPEDALADAFRLYYYRKPTEISNDNSYIFEGSTDIPHYKIFDEALFKYYRWQASSILQKSSQQIDAEEKAYKVELSEKMSLIRRRPDMSRKRRTRMRIGHIPRCY